jgi:GDP-4-dehydro-6-deoxy-D-mannose reductase
VTGTLNVLEAVLRHASEAPIVLLGSAAEYGRVDPERLPIREGETCRPLGFYGRSKLAQTHLGETAAATWGQRVRTARLFNVVGPGMPARFFFPTLAERIRSASAGDTFPLRDGAATRDFIHVDDVAEAVMTLLDPGLEAGVYNVATGVETSIVATAAFLGRLAGGVRALPEGPDTNPVRSVGDATRLHRLGWTPRRSWQEALTEVWQSSSSVA